MFRIARPVAVLIICQGALLDHLRAIRGLLLISLHKLREAYVPCSCIWLDSDQAKSLLLQAYPKPTPTFLRDGFEQRLPERTSLLHLP